MVLVGHTGMLPMLLFNLQGTSSPFLFLSNTRSHSISHRINIANQGYIDVKSAQNPALGYGADGIAGLGFTSLSTVDALVNHTGADTGRSLLFNAFDDNPNEPNFIAFSLQRNADPDDDVQGTFSIGGFFLHLILNRNR